MLDDTSLPAGLRTQSVTDVRSIRSNDLPQPAPARAPCQTPAPNCTTTITIMTEAYPDDPAAAAAVAPAYPDTTREKIPDDQHDGEKVPDVQREGEKIPETEYGGGNHHGDEHSYRDVSERPSMEIGRAHV